ncbi:MAG: hypothetical protein HC799_07895 [Limnothrix sp. RL_2_0]|nr:hypothetical protein [Limnothrix sp. RL_2_0]
MTTKTKIITVIAFGLIAAFSSFGVATKSDSTTANPQFHANNGEPVDVAERGSGRREQDVQSSSFSEGVFG